MNQEATIEILKHINPPKWATDALCAQTDPDAFFPNQGDTAKQAKQTCNNCPVKHECRTHALNNTDQGIWGGLSEKQRRRHRRTQQ